MATVPGQLIWEIIKKNNSFLVKEFGNGTAKVQFSRESNNLYNRHSFKHSGISLYRCVYTFDLIFVFGLEFSCYLFHVFCCLSNVFYVGKNV